MPPPAHRPSARRPGLQVRRAARPRAPGQVLVIAAASIAALLAFAAVIINMGMFLQERRHLQSSADAMALAGAQKLLEEQVSRSLRDAIVQTALTTFASKNNVPLGAGRTLTGSYVNQAGSSVKATGSGGQFPDTAVGVDVTVSGPFSTMLPALLKVEPLTAGAGSRAGLTSVAYPSTLLNPIPIGVPLAALEADNSFDLYDQSIASSVYGVDGYLPFLDLANPSNSGTGFMAPADFGDDGVNQQFWSDGVHGSGQIGIGNTIVIEGDDYSDEVAAGLLDNVRRQALTDSCGSAYALLDLPVWDAYTEAGSADGDTVHVVGFARFKINRSDISSDSLPGYFVPYLVATPGPGSAPDLLWGPSQIKILR